MSREKARDLSPMENARDLSPTEGARESARHLLTVEDSSASPRLLWPVSVVMSAECMSLSYSLQNCSGNGSVIRALFSNEVRTALSNVLLTVTGVPELLSGLSFLFWFVPGCDGREQRYICPPPMGAGSAALGGGAGCR